MPRAPSTRPRCEPGKVLVRMAGALAKSIVAPMAWTPRSAMSHPAVGASPQSAEPSTNRAKPPR